MSPPIDIDGSEIQEATIDGQDVSEITIDGQQAADLNVIPDSVLTQDLVAWYRFEDGDARDYTNDLDATFADSTAYDGTVNGATFQSSGGVTDFETGSNSGAFSFNGSDNEIRTGLTTNFTTSQTLHAWIEPQTNSTQRSTIISKNSVFASFESDFPIDLFIDNSDNLIVFALSDDDDFIQDLALTAPVSYDSYQHVVASYQGNGTCKLIIDGSVVDSQTFNSTISSNSREYVVGNVPLDREGGENETQYNGIIDDVRIYNRNISQAEADEIFNDTKP